MWFEVTTTLPFCHLSVPNSPGHDIYNRAKAKIQIFVSILLFALSRFRTSDGQRVDFAMADKLWIWRREVSLYFLFTLAVWREATKCGANAEKWDWAHCANTGARQFVRRCYLSLALGPSVHSRIRRSAIVTRISTWSCCFEPSVYHSQCRFG